MTVLLGLLYAAKVTGALQLYSCPSEANEPTFKMNTRLFVSKFKKPERFDFIIFKRDDFEVPGTKISIVYRLCGLPGDKVEIKNGVLWVNGNNADQHLNVMNEYLVTRPDEMNRVRALVSGADESNPVTTLKSVWRDSLVANLSRAYVMQNRLQCRLYVSNPSANNPIAQKWGTNWSIDNFGPVIVPKDNFLYWVTIATMRSIPDFVAL